MNCNHIYDETQTCFECGVNNPASPLEIRHRDFDNAVLGYLINLFWTANEADDSNKWSYVIGSLEAMSVWCVTEQDEDFDDYFLVEIHFLMDIARLRNAMKRYN